MINEKLVEMEFPIGLAPENEQDPYVSVDLAIQILHQYPDCRIEALDDLIGWGALVGPERKRLGIEPFSWNPLEFYVQKYSSLEEYLRKGYVEWRGGYGCKLIVPHPIPELPFRIQISKKTGRDRDGSWSKTVIWDCKVQEEKMYYWHSCYFSAARNGIYISRDPPPRVARVVETGKSQ